MNAQFDISAAEARIKAAGITIEDFCRTAGVSRSTWQRWKAGATRPMLATWEKVADSLPAALEPEPHPVPATPEAAE